MENGSLIIKALGDAEPEKERGFNPVRKKWVPRGECLLMWGRGEERGY